VSLSPRCLSFFPPECCCAPIFQTSVIIPPSLLSPVMIGPVFHVHSVLAFLLRLRPCFMLPGPQCPTPLPSCIQVRVKFALPGLGPSVVSVFSERSLSDLFLFFTHDSFIPSIGLCQSTPKNTNYKWRIVSSPFPVLCSAMTIIPSVKSVASLQLKGLDKLLDPTHLSLFFGLGSRLCSPVFWVSAVSALSDHCTVL